VTYDVRVVRNRSIMAIAVFTLMVAAPNARAFCFGTIHVHVFNDTNLNGVVDPGETPRAGVAVQLDQLGDGTIEHTLITDANGDANFLAPAVVPYAMSIVAPAGTVQSSANPALLNLTCNVTTNVSFALVQAVPALSRTMLALLTLALGSVALLAMRRAT
jgi:hypothetical protein